MSPLRLVGVVALGAIAETAAFSFPSAGLTLRQPFAQSAAARAPRAPRFAGLRMQEESAGKAVPKVLDISDMDVDAAPAKTVAVKEAPASTEAALKTAEAVAEKPKAATPAAQQVAKRSAAQEKVEEPNVYAEMALKYGLLKERSPLLFSPMVGNKGFDPLNLASDNGLLLQYREAELKHGRLAMLASVGWVFSELFHNQLALWTNNPTYLQAAANGEYEKAPSVLNGGLELVPVSLWIGTFLVAAIAEMFRLFATWENPMSFTPGDLGFDPLGFSKQADERERAELALKEVNNGRLAMLAIAAFAAKEKLVDSAIVNQSPELFTKGPLSYAFQIPGLAMQYTGLFSCNSGLVYCGEGQDAMQSLMKVGGDAAAQAEQAAYINEIMGSLFM
jgi:hypothetical protein